MQCLSGNLVLVEVVLDMDEGFLAVAVDVEYVSVEDANLVLPAVLDGVAVEQNFVELRGRIFFPRHPVAFQQLGRARERIDRGCCEYRG